MASISLRSLTKRFGEVTAVDQLDLDLREGELVAFLGPSGCGKTTTLRLVAGFEVADEGSVYLGDRDVTHLPPEKRNAGMVFQNYALFPHLTVAENVAFGLEMRGLSRAEVENRVRMILAKVQLTGLEQRYPRQLSGGQQQRTALARALVINPSVLLLDEPLANLDAKLREEMRFYIRSLQREFGITTIYVTHDQAEALVLADRVAVMMTGVLQQIGTPEEIYRRPRTPRVADFVGLTNFIPGEVRERCDGDVAIATKVGVLRCRAGAEARPGSRGLLCVRPESLHLRDGAGAASAAPETNQLDGTVRARAYLGNLIDYRIAVGHEVVLRVQGAPSPSYDVGEPVGLSFAAEDTWLVQEAGA